MSPAAGAHACHGPFGRRGIDRHGFDHGNYAPSVDEEGPIGVAIAPVFITELPRSHEQEIVAPFDTTWDYLRRFPFSPRLSRTMSLRILRAPRALEGIVRPHSRVYP